MCGPCRERYLNQYRNTGHKEKDGLDSGKGSGNMSKTNQHAPDLTGTPEISLEGKMSGVILNNTE